jgi:uncharacterized delta-60 repeat protein
MRTRRAPLVVLVAASIGLAAAWPALAAAGDLDPTFSGDGRVITPIGLLGQDTGNGVVVEPDGRIVVAGSSSTATVTDEPHDIAVVRYLPDGSRDPAFGTKGIYTLDLSGQDFAYDVALAPGGDLVVVGTAILGGDYDVVVVRLTDAGVPDTAFGGGDGIVTTALTGLGDRARAVAVQDDGRIVVAGETGSTGGAGDVFVARYLAGGGLDGTFSGDGVATLDVLGRGGADAARDLVLDRDGRAVITGSTNDGARDLIFVARYTTGGTLDRTFSGDGKRTISFGAGPEVGYAALVQGDGAIVAGGYALSGANGTFDFALARLTPDGAFDATFGGGDGKVLTDFLGRNDFCYALAPAPGGRIVGTGGARSGDSLPLEDVATARWLAP